MPGSPEQPKLPVAADPRFQYQQIGPAGISLNMWDRMAAAIFTTDPSWLGLIKSSVLATFGAIYIIGRRELIKMQQEFEKQQYERGQAGQNRDDLNRDDLSSEKRP